MPEPDLIDLSASLRRNEPTLPDYLNELEAHFGRREPQVTAFLPEEGRFARLRREAEALVPRFPDPENRPLLFGAPIGVKDIFHADGFVTRAGASIPVELLQGREGPAVSALRAAGAMILGKTITTEFAYFAPGPTRHPLSAALGETRTPGGSSSGSAAAVAARLCPLALGTQTIGSIIRPAAYCGVVGFKPTYGRVSSDGLIPLAPSADTVGFFVRAAADATLVASLLCADWRPVESLRRSPVLGIPEGLYLQRASAEALAHFHRTCDRLIRQGITLRALSVMPDFDDIYARHNDLVAAEAARIHAGWFVAYGERYHPKTAELIRRGQGVSGEAYHAALAGRETLRTELTALMDDQGLDAWICPPAVGPAPSGLESTGDPVMALPWTHAGMPALSLPAGTDPAGWPMGLQIVGRYGQDEQLLAVAAIIEEVIGLL